MPSLHWGDVPTWLTAVGTIAVAVAAVWIALWSERRSDKRLAEERENSATLIAEERALADKRLAEQLAHSDAQLAEERAAADTRLAEEIRAANERLQQERQVAQDREQWAEAYLVQVTPARAAVAPPAKQPADEPVEPVEPVERPVVIVVNHGRYTITRIQAQLCTGGNSLTGYGKTEHLSSWFNLPEELRPQGIWDARSVGLGNTLTPMDLGLRYTSDVMAVKFLVGSYPIVRWTDRWGTCWQHKQGDVHQVAEGEDWKP
jgi:hypothetical protein